MVIGGRLFASGMDGVVYRLAAGHQEWESIAALRERRFFHRLLPGVEGQLLFVGGANRNGHLRSLEVLALEEPGTARADRPDGACIDSGGR